VSPWLDDELIGARVLPMPHRLFVFVDVDDTLVRSVGTKRIPMRGVVASIR